jgi:Protein of unknown function (DUF4232)
MHIPVLSRRRLAGVAAIACAAGLAPAAALAAAGSPTASSAAGVSRCPASGLVIWMDTPGSNAAGSVYYTLMFTNLSGHTCTLDGHPGVSAVGLGGHRIGSPAAWDPPAAQPVTLANGGTAYVILQYSNVVIGNSGPRPCDPVTAAGLRVHPPGEAAFKIVPIPLKACTTSVTFMGVRPVQQTPPPGQGS